MGTGKVNYGSQVFWGMVLESDTIKEGTYRDFAVKGFHKVKGEFKIKS